MFNDISLITLLSAVSLLKAGSAAPMDSYDNSHTRPSGSYNPGRYDPEQYNQASHHANNEAINYADHSSFNQDFSAMHLNPYGGVQYGHDTGSSYAHQFHQDTDPSTPVPYNFFPQSHGHESEQYSNMYLPVSHGSHYGSESSSSLAHHGHHDRDINLNLELGLGPGSRGSIENVQQATPDSSESSPAETGQEGSGQRHNKLKEYEWQKPLLDEQVLQVYETIASHWDPAVRSTLRHNTERLSAFLERNSDLVLPILNNDVNAIKEAVNYSRPSYSVTSGSNSNQNFEPLTKIYQWLKSDTIDEGDGRKRSSSWAPEKMNLKKQNKLVEVLHRGWMKDRDCVRKLLVAMGPVEVEKWAPKLLVKNTEEAYRAAEELAKAREKEGIMNRRRAQEEMKNRSKSRSSRRNVQEHLQMPYYQYEPVVMNSAQVNQPYQDHYQDQQHMAEQYQSHQAGESAQHQQPWGYTLDDIMRSGGHGHH